MEQIFLLFFVWVKKNTYESPGIQCKKVFWGIFLKEYHSSKGLLIEERAIEAATYIIEHNATVRQTARHMGISKSTVHKDVTERLMRIDSVLAHKARKVLDVNKAERHIRGGMATKEKYLKM